MFPEGTAGLDQGFGLPKVHSPSLQYRQLLIGPKPQLLDESDIRDEDKISMVLMAVPLLLVLVCNLLLSLGLQVELLPVHCLHCQDMEDKIDDLGETLVNEDQLDPKAPLSPEDLVKLLMQYSNDRVRENARDSREKLEESVEHERNFTDEKLKTIAYHVNKRFNT